MSQVHVHTDKLSELLSHDGTLMLSVPTCTQERTAILTLLLESAVVVQQRRTRQKQAMLRALLDASPPCSSATLYAACMGMREGEAQICIEGGQKGEVLNIALLSVREVLWQCERKLEPFHLDIRPGDAAVYGRFRFWERRAE